MQKIALEQQEQEQERNKEEEVHIDQDVARVLQLAQLATLNFSGLGIRARREAIERAVAHRPEDGAYSVDFGTRVKMILQWA
jgi:hypothetical protein